MSWCFLASVLLGGRGLKRFLSKMSKVDPNSHLDSRQQGELRQHSYSHYVERLLKGYQYEVMTSLIHFNHSLMV